MNKYVKEFLHRGLIFAGFGPIIVAIVFFFFLHTHDDFSLLGQECSLAIVTTYILAFVHAGASVFNQIEHWSVMKSLFCHMSILYVVYLACYLINSWIPFEIMLVLMFTAIFVISYLVIWAIVYLCVKGKAKKLSEKLA